MKKDIRCVVIGAAPINNYEQIKKELSPESDFYIFCDGGLNHQKSLGVTPNLIVGDFDSHEKPAQDAETPQIITLPREKDDTDTFFAVKEALSRGFTEFLLTGVTGKRLDHTLSNISILLYLDSLELKAKIIDDYAQMQILKNKTTYTIDDTWAFFSLTALAGEASGIKICDAKFPVKNARIIPSYQYAISNETLPGKKASVFVKKGKILLSKIYR